MPPAQTDFCPGRRYRAPELARPVEPCHSDMVTFDEVHSLCHACEEAALMASHLTTVCDALGSLIAEDQVTVGATVYHRAGVIEGEAAAMAGTDIAL